MSVLIKGMKMPTSCEKCPCKTADAFGGLGCQATGYIPLRKVNQNRPDWCPLVPIPPHGRLGDLDSLALLVLNWISTQEKAYLHEDSNALAWRLGAKAMGNQIYRDIKAYPTVIPAEPEEEETK